jgi:hypothetical protein
MSKKPTNDVLKARVEAAELLGFGDDPQRLCIADRLRVDLVVSLRAAIDHASASLLDDGSSSSDLARLVAAVESSRSSCLRASLLRRSHSATIRVR